MRLQERKELLQRIDIARWMWNEYLQELRKKTETDKPTENQRLNENLSRRKGALDWRSKKAVAALSKAY